MLSPFATSLEDLSAEDPDYQNGFVTYLSLLKVPDILVYFKENIEKYVSDTNNRLRVLSVGCGDGRFDLGLLDIIARRYPLLDIEYVGLEPNIVRLALFKTNISSYSSISRIHFHLEQIDFDEYEHQHSDEKFNLILCIRVLYHLHDRLESVFLQLINRLTANGKILAVHQSPSGIAQIVHAAGLDQLSPAYVCNTYHLRQALEKLTSQVSSLKFSILYLDNYVDISCLKNVNSNEKFERDKVLSLLTFFLGKKLQNINRELLEKLVMQRILPMVAFQKQFNSESFLMFQPVGVILIELCS